MLVVDALRYSLLLERNAYAGLTRVLRKMEKHDVTEHPREAYALSAIGNAWAMIDIAHRVRGLVTQISGLPHRNPEVQLFLRSTKSVEDFRNLYQHLSSGLARLSMPTNPVMGVVSWVTKEPRHSITIYVGTGTRDIQVHTVAYDRQDDKFPQVLLFSAGNRDIEIDKLHASCRRISSFVDKWLVSSGHLSDQVLEVSVIRFQIRSAD